LSDHPVYVELSEYISNNKETVKKTIENCHFMNYSQLAKFISCCDEIDHNLTVQIIDDEAIIVLISNFNVTPRNYKGLGQLINSLYSIDPNLSSFFLLNNKVKGRIQQSINESDWNNFLDDLEFLIEAFYRAVPKLWNVMVNKNYIKADLSALNLDSIYCKVNGKNKF
jgi:hypothetical protein